MSHLTRKRLRPILLALIGLATGAVLLALVVRKVSFAEFWQTLLTVHPRWIVYGFTLAFFGMPLKVYRWQMIFPARSRPRFRRSFIALTVGYFMNNLLPARGGDFARCLFVGERIRLDGASLAFATLVVEKVLDGLVLLLVVMVAFTVFVTPVWMRELGILAGAGLVAATVGLVLLHYKSAWLLERVRRLFRAAHLESFGVRFARLLARFSDGLAIIRSWRQVLWVGVLTAASWAIDAALVGLLGAAFGLHLHVSYMITVSAVLGLGLMVPAAPGYVGTYQFLVVAALGLFHVDANTAFALSVVMHALVLTTTTVFGLGGVALGGATAFRLMRASANAEAKDW